MKELSIEEKAKAYDKALDRAKELLLKDLCARLPYNTKVSMDYGFGQPEIKKLCIVHISQLMGNQCTSKPYLLPMSSMTDDERKNFIKCAGYEVEESENGRHYDYYLKDSCGTEDAPCANAEAIDWLNAHHFDYRGLIDKGLAIEVTEKNNPYKD